MRALLSVLLLCGVLARGAEAQAQEQTGSVIFFHPDGMGLNHWGAVRMHSVGPDGRLNWDRLPGMAVYLGHMEDSLTASSEGGATTHAYGVRANSNAYGMPSRPRASLAWQAMQAGRWVGLVNSGSAIEPGTGAHIASVARRSDRDETVAQLVESGIHVHLAGGERWYLPRGVQGRFGEGRRLDGRNLVQELRAKGYTIVYTAAELKALPADATRVWGIFAFEHTFNDAGEEQLAQRNLPLYQPGTPSIAEMSEAALRILSRAPQGFFLVVEEEGTDNFANANNASGQLEAGRRADEAIGVFARHVAANPRTLMLTTSDSDAGGLQVIGPGDGDRRPIREGQPIRDRDENGAPWDGSTGTRSAPFLSAPDRNGRRHRFAITWATQDDVTGGVLVRGVGLNSGMIAGTMENVDVYRVMYRTLFGRMPE